MMPSISKKMPAEENDPVSSSTWPNNDLLFVSVDFDLLAVFKDVDVQESFAFGVVDLQLL
jgi:hypothetical protein